MVSDSYISPFVALAVALTIFCITVRNRCAVIALAPLLSKFPLATLLAKPRILLCILFGTL